MVQILGWFNAEAARASRRNRSKACPSLARSVRQKLQGDESPKLRILSFIDHAHPTATELLEDAVMRDGLTDHWAGMLGLQRSGKSIGDEEGPLDRLVRVYKSQYKAEPPVLLFKNSAHCTTPEPEGLIQGNPITMS